MEAVTETLGRFIADTRFSSLPEQAVKIAKVHFLDALGCMLAGSTEAAPRIMGDYVAGLGGQGKSTVIPRGDRLAAPYAALANGVTAHVLDFDDYDWLSMVHPSATVLPAVLALAEQQATSGRDVLAAYLVGMEVIPRIGLAVNPSHYESGWHSTGTVGPLGAAAGASFLMRLDAGQTAMALGMAASMAAGLRANFGSMTKPYHAGHAARCGVEAALLVASGFTAGRGVLEAKSGFCDVFTRGGVSYPERIIRAPDEPFSLESPGMGLKRFPSCAATHSTLDAVFHLIEQHDIRADDVAGVECGIFYLYPTMLIHADPKTGLEGKFSLEFCVAAALCDREVGVATFTDAKVREPGVQRIIKCVNKEVTDEVGARGTRFPGATVKIRLKDGRNFSQKTEVRKGSPGDPLSEEEIVNKFLKNAGASHRGSRSGEIVERVLHLEKERDLSRVVALLCGAE